MNQVGTRVKAIFFDVDYEARRRVLAMHMDRVTTRVLSEWMYSVAVRFHKKP